jgi:hypothetical protein
VTLAILLASAAAAAFAAGTALQHRAASSVPRPGTSAAGLVGGLVRRPSWLLGLGLSGVAFCLHAAALREGSLALVQPIVVSTIVFAVFIRAGLDRRLPGRPEVGWALVAFMGLALFIATLRTRAALHPADGRRALVFLVSSVTVAAVAVLCARRTSRPARRGLLLGVAAGILFGLIAGLVKVLVAQASGGVVAVLGNWPLWALLVAGAAALVLSQHAYQAARLSVTIPVLNIVDVVGALAFGLVVFGEELFATPAGLLAEVLGLVAMGLGVWKLAHHQELSAFAPQDQPAEGLASGQRVSP